MDALTDETIGVRGMTCGGCVQSVTRVLRAFPGVVEVEVSLERQEARVRFDASQATSAALRAAIEQAGFEVH